MILFDQVHYTYPNGSHALEEIDLELADGSFTFLTGHTGAGKTTLIRLMMAMMRPSSGHLKVGEQSLNRISASDVPLYRRNIGLVFQDHQLLYDRNVLDNVALPLEILGYDYDTIHNRAEAALRKVGLETKKGKMPQHLSVGEQQRLSIARAVVAKPAILIADEPTGNLDEALSRRVMEFFREFYLAGTTVIIATHDMRLVASYPDARVVQLQEGRLV